MRCGQGRDLPTGASFFNCPASAASVWCRGGAVLRMAGPPLRRATLGRRSFFLRPGAVKQRSRRPRGMGATKTYGANAMSRRSNHPATTVGRAAAVDRRRFLGAAAAAVLPVLSGRGSGLWAADEAKPALVPRRRTPTTSSSHSPPSTASSRPATSFTCVIISPRRAWIRRRGGCWWSGPWQGPWNSPTTSCVTCRPSRRPSRSNAPAMAGRS